MSTDTTKTMAPATTEGWNAGLLHAHAACLDGTSDGVTAATIDALGWAADRLETQDAEIATLTTQAEEDAEFVSDIIKAICGHVGLDPDPEGYTAADLESLLEEHNAEFDRIDAESKASKGLAQELATEMVRAHDIIGDFNRWHSDPGTDALSSEWVICRLIDKARAAGLLPPNPKAREPQAGTKALVFNIPAALHPDTADLIAEFASALATKLRASEIKYGWTANWMRKGWRDELASELLRHVHKGDPRDAAAYCAFAWFHGWSVAPTPTAPQPQPDALVEAHSGVLAEVAAERRRQIEVEGWSPAHDDEHGNGEMASAAACYCLHAGHSGVRLDCGGKVPSDWPWADGWWKPKDRRRDLIRALALLTAEVERIDRAALRTARQSGQPEGEGKGNA